MLGHVKKLQLACIVPCFGTRLLGQVYSSSEKECKSSKLVTPERGKLQPTAKKASEQFMSPPPRTKKNIVFATSKSSTSLTGRVAQSSHQRGKRLSVLELPGWHGIHHRHQCTVHLSLAGAALSYQQSTPPCMLTMFASGVVERRSDTIRAKAAPKVTTRSSTASVYGYLSQDPTIDRSKTGRKRKATYFHATKADQVPSKMCVPLQSTILL